MVGEPEGNFDAVGWEDSEGLCDGENVILGKKETEGLLVGVIVGVILGRDETDGLFVGVIVGVILGILLGAVDEIEGK